jgi:hypothetical protein
VIVGGYTLDLYCDRESTRHAYKEFPHVFYAQTGSRCRREARAVGWNLTRGGEAICPKCSGKKGTK